MNHPQRNKADPGCDPRSPLLKKTADTLNDVRCAPVRQIRSGADRWKPRAEAEAAFQRWHVSGGQDIVARDAASRAYDAFLRGSNWSGDVTFVRYDDACLDAKRTTRSERDRLAVEHRQAVSATVDHAVRTLRAALVADGRLS